MRFEPQALSTRWTSRPSGPSHSGHCVPRRAFAHFVWIYEYNFTRWHFFLSRVDSTPDSRFKGREFESETRRCVYGCDIPTPVGAVFAASGLASVHLILNNIEPYAVPVIIFVPFEGKPFNSNLFPFQLSQQYPEMTNLIDRTSVFWLTFSWSARLKTPLDQKFNLPNPKILLRPLLPLNVPLDVTGWIFPPSRSLTTLFRDVFSVKARQQGNEFYRSVSEDLAPTVRIPRLRQAINLYDRAISLADNAGDAWVFSTPSPVRVSAQCFNSAKLGWANPPWLIEDEKIWYRMLIVDTSQPQLDQIFLFCACANSPEPPTDTYNGSNDNFCKSGMRLLTKTDKYCSYSQSGHSTLNNVHVRMRILT